MKREALNHTKMHRLARILDLPLWGARGICESLWLVTEREAPQGDIGKLTDEDIAIAIDWRDAVETLIEALKHAGFIETDEYFRLIVHDWSDHCQDNVHTKLARAGLLFCDGKVPNMNKLPMKERPELARRLSSARRALGKRSKAPAERSQDRFERLPDHTVPDHTVPYQTIPDRLPQTSSNPLVDRPKLIEEGYSLISEIAPRENLDPTEVARKATDWNGRGYVRLDVMPDDRLAHSVASLRSWKRRLDGAPEPGPPQTTQPRRETIAEKNERMLRTSGSTGEGPF